MKVPLVLCEFREPLKRMIYVVNIWLIYGYGDISIAELPVDEYPLVIFDTNWKMAQSK